MRKIHGDDKARASFAMVGVLFLLLGSVSAVYLAAVNNEFRNIQIENKEIRRMDIAVGKAHIEVQAEAYHKALSAILLTTQMDNSQSLNTLFQEKFSQYLNDNFPRRKEDLDISINNHQALLVPKQKNALDFDNYNRMVSREYQGVDGNVEFKEFDLSVSDVYGRTTKTVYYSALGYVNYTVKETNSKRTLNKNLTFDRSVKCPYPLLEGSFQTFAANAQGESTDLGRMIKYILTTIAQFRVLNGYGIGDENNDGVSEPGEGTDWKSVIDKEDVELAVNLAILLEEIKRYRTLDPQSLSALDIMAYNRYDEARAGIGQDNPNDSPANRTIKRLLEKYATLGTIDAADIFALYACIDSSTMDIESIFAQSMYSVVDQYAQEFLDHFGLGENAQDLTGFITNIFYWFGIDSNIFVDPGMYTDDGEWVRAYGDGYYETITEHITAPSSSWNKGGNWQWDSPGGYYGNQKGDGKYGNNANEALSKTITLIPDFDDENDVDTIPLGSIDEETFFYGSCVTSLSFESKIRLNDLNDIGEVQIKGPDDSTWQTLDTFTSDHDWTAKSYNISSYFGQSNIQIRFRFQSNGTGVDEGWRIRDIDIEKRYFGKDVMDSSVGGESVEIDAYFKDLVSATSGVIINPLSWFQDTVRGYLSDLFKGLAKFTADNVFSLLFNGVSPQLPVNPKDEESILEYLESTAYQWTYDAIIALKDDIENSEDFIVDAAKDFLNMVKVQILNFAVIPLNIWLDDVENWVNEGIDVIAIILESLAEAKEGFLANATGFFGLSEFFSDLGDMISNIVDDFLLWNTIENDIKNAINSVIAQVNSAAAGITDFVNDLSMSGVEPFLDALRDVVFSFLDASAQFINLSMNEIIRGSEIADTEFQIGSNYDKPFEFWNGDFSWAENAKSIDYENVNVLQKPRYLNATEKDRTEISLDNVDIDDEDTNNDLLVFMGDPKGIHYTKPLGTSNRPFETHWDILIAGRINLSTRTDNRIFLGNGTHYYTWCNGTLNINLSETITVFSGWELEDVDYESSNIFSDDEIDFLDSVWEELVTITNWGIDSFHKFIANLGDIIRMANEEGARLGERIAGIFGTLREALRNAQDPSSLNFVDNILDEAEKLGARGIGPFSAYGFQFVISTNDDHTNITLYQENGTFMFTLTMEEDDMELIGNLSFWCVDADIEMHPLNELDWLTVHGSIDYTGFNIPYPVDGWEFDIRAPDTEDLVSVEISVESVWGENIQISTSTGATISSNFGLELKVSEDVIDEMEDIIIEPIVDIFEEKLQDREIEMSVLDFISIVEEIGTGLFDNVVGRLSQISDFEVFFDLAMADDSIGEGETRIAFVVRNSTDTITTFFKWFLNNAENLIFSILGSFNPSNMGRAFIPLENCIFLTDSHWQYISFKNGYDVDDSELLEGAEGIATSSMNIPFIMETHTPSFFDTDVGESHAECGLVVSEETGTGESGKYNVERTIWLLKLEIREWHGP